MFISKDTKVKYHGFSTEFPTHAIYKYIFVTNAFHALFFIPSSVHRWLST